MTATLFPATTVRPATARQIDFILTLANERGVVLSDETIADLTSSSASAKIDELKAMPRPRKAAERATVTVDEGVYEMDGVIYKVKAAVHGSGRLYAQRLHVQGEGKDADIWYAMERGAISKLRPEHKLTKERAQAFGALYGTCIRCARTLTDEDSIERMMGRICASKMGW